MRIHSKLAAAAATLAGVAFTIAPLAAQDLAIRNATVITIANGDIPNGTVLVRNGKIAAVGRNVSIPAGVRVIDGTGKYVMPGIIDAHSHAALENGINEGSESVTPEVRVQVHVVRHVRQPLGGPRVHGKPAHVGMPPVVPREHPAAGHRPRGRRRQGQRGDHARR